MRTYVAFLLILVLSTDAGAIGNRRRARNSYETTPQIVYGSVPAPISTPTGSNALAEVNAARAARGLRSYIEDPDLTAAAQACAEYRARYGIQGHVTGGMGDFGFLPAGSWANAAGCGALDPSWGFQSCCQFENWTFAGAATVRGRDGKLYHHLFVRN